MINVKPSAKLRTNYNEVEEFCKTTHEPVFLTKNGEGSLVVMDEVAYSVLMHKEEILAGLALARNSREDGEKGYNPEEVFEMCEKTIKRIECEQ